MRKSKNFLRNFLSREQRIMLKFDRTNVIEVNSSEEDEGVEDRDLSDIDDDITTGLQSNNGLVAVFSLARLLKVLTPFAKQRKLSKFDLNLFYSFYSNEVKEQPEELKSIVSSVLKKKGSGSPTI